MNAKIMDDKKEIQGLRLSFKFLLESCLAFASLLLVLCGRAYLLPIPYIINSMIDGAYEFMR
jgi:hypothetical protein